ncbi:UbiA prenyltransferase family protein [Amycolatopsis sacchari]|uniref:UbiA prenyltransferase family protein n=1 Tax=Amycolatopsis sacchari TaxID=115433 RepID=UPI0015A66FFA|nr:UbiA family prenyltransferase [Amycolatopsis sacchari]
MPGLGVRPSWHDVVVLHRLQFPLPVNYVCYALWGCLFAGPALLRTPAALLAVAADLLLIVAPLALNVAVDMATDSQHADKGYLAGAAGRIGRSRALNWSIAELAVAFAAVVAIGVGWGRWWPLGIAVVTVAAQLLYNVEPARLKRRGLAGSVAFGVASVGLPVLLGYTAVAPAVPATVWLIIAGASLISVGRTVWWALPDYDADVASRIATPTVRYGPARTLVVACGFVVVGLVLLGWGLWARYGAWALLGLAPHGGFLALLVAQLPATLRGHPPRAGSQLRRTLPVATLGEVLTALVPLLGG